MCPHDVYDWWVETYGRNLDAFWPVADTEIGRLGIMMANEGSYPENARALAMNGAEVVYRALLSRTRHVGNELFEIQNRARALDNNMYLVAPQHGDVLPARGRPTRRSTRSAAARSIDRLPGPDRRARSDYGAGVDLGRRADRHRGAAQPPGRAPSGTTG